MPDDAALFAPGQTALRAFDGVILIIATDLFPAFIEDDEVMNQIQEARFLEHGIELLIQFIVKPSTSIEDFQIVERQFVQMVFESVFLPLQIMLLRRKQRAIAQSLAGIGRHTELDCSEKLLDEVSSLIREILPNTIRDGNCALF